MHEARVAHPIRLDELGLFIESFLMRWEGLNTQAAYRQDLNTFCDWCTEHGLHPIRDVKRPHLELYMKWLAEERDCSSGTVSRRIGTLSQFFEVAIDDDLIARNPTRLVRRPKPQIDPTRRIALSRQEMQRIARAAYDSCPSDYALIVAMGYLGLRVSEACGLDVPDCLYIAKGHRCLRFKGKGGQLAVIPQPPIVMRSIDAAIGGRSSGPLLLRRDGSRQTRRSADRVVKRCAKAAALASPVSPHMLRHTFVVNALDAGVAPRVVQLSARHADLSTTLKIYDRGRECLDSHAAHALAAYYGSPM